MNLRVERFSDNGQSTLGILFERERILKGYRKHLLCYTMEDEKREEKIAGETRIPEGTYYITLRKEGGFHEDYKNRFSDIHKGMLHIREIPNFTNVLIHCGNTEKDTAGCLLVGNGQFENVTDNGSVKSSSLAYKRIYPKIANAIDNGELVSIEYVDTTIHHF